MIVAAGLTVLLAFSCTVKEKGSLAENSVYNNDILPQVTKTPEPANTPDAVKIIIPETPAPIPTEEPTAEPALTPAADSAPTPESAPEPTSESTPQPTPKPASEPALDPAPANTPDPIPTPTQKPTPEPAPKPAPTPPPASQKDINPYDFVFYSEPVRVTLTEEDEAEIERLYQEMRNDPLYSDLKDWQIQAMVSIEVMDRKLKEAGTFESEYFTKEETDKIRSYPCYEGEPKHTFEFVYKSYQQFAFTAMEKLVYLIKYGSIEFENNQKFYTEYNLTYCTRYNYYAIRGRLETQNSDGSITKQIIEIIIKDGWMDKNSNLIPKLVDIVVLE